jgi:hypothetical protein
MSRSVDTIAEMEYLEQRVSDEAPALLARALRIIEDRNLAEDLVLDAFRRLWKFRDTYGLDRSVDTICLRQCLRYLDTSGTAALSDRRREALTGQFTRPLDRSENLRAEQIDVDALWERVLLLLDEDEHRSGKYRTIVERSPYRAILYIVGMVIVVALIFVYLARSPQPASPVAPGMLTAQTGSTDTTDLLFLNDVRIWLLPGSQVVYPEDLGTTRLELTVRGEVVVRVPESVAAPVSVRSDGHLFGLSGGLYRMQLSDSKLSAALFVVSGTASWMRQSSASPAIRIPAGHSLHVQLKGGNWQHSILDTGAQQHTWPF